MHRSILVPLDGSTFGEYALPIARSLALRSGATVHLVHVHMPVIAGYIGGKVIYNEKLEAQNRERERVYLKEIVKRLAARSDLSAIPALLDEPSSVPDILHHYMKAMDIDLVVMTTHGRGALARFWLGSVTDELVRRAEKPLLLIRPPKGAEAAPDLTREQVFQHLLIPLDGSPLAEQVLEPAVALGKLMQADYSLLRVLEPVTPIAPHMGYSAGVDQQWADQGLMEAKAYLDGVAERLRRQSLQVQTKVRVHQHPARAILEEAEEQGIDLIAIATQGYGGLTRWLVGSVADKVLRGASMPVLLHRPHEESS